MGNYLLTFADTNLTRSIYRFKRQALKMNFYDEVFCFDETNLDFNFKKKFESKLIYGSRGFGYWSWKPQIIMQVLKQLKEGDILQYTDVGCHLNQSGRERLLEYFNYTKESDTGILAFKASPPVHPLKHDGRKLFNQRDYMYIQGDLIDYFNFRKHPEFINDYCIGATAIFIKKCDYSLKIVEEWLEVINKDFTLIDNTPSVTENYPGFIEHRHDQAIFSLLCKKNNVVTLSTYEYYYPKVNSIYPDWQHLKLFPIHAKRDKDFGFIKNNRLIVIRIINKIKKIFYVL